MPTVYNGNSASYPSGANLPADGDLRNASSVNVPLEALLDRTAYLKNRIASYAYVDTSSTGISSTSSTTFADTALVEVVDATGVAIGDLLLVSCHAHMEVTPTGANVEVRLKMIEDFGGAAVVNTSLGAHSIFDAMQNGRQPFAFNAVHVATRAGTHRFHLQILTTAGTCTLETPMVLRVLRVRL